MESPRPELALISELVDDRYRVRRLIGQGGMGAVYEAEAVRLGRLCAFKVLLPEYTRSETAVQRFRREALVASRVKHPNVVDIFDTGTTVGGLGYIAMELLHGESLGRTLRREGRLPWPRARHIAVQMCRALSAAHARGVVHRDMKPDNCFRLRLEGDPDFIKILDFGIAKLVDTEGADVRLTATDSVIGTCSYMSFEQIKGLDPDHRVDIWAVGVILYEMLTGVLPFRGENERQIWSAIFTQTPTPIRDLLPGEQFPPELDAIIARALEKTRDARFQTADSLAHALETVSAARAAVTGVGSTSPAISRTAGPIPPGDSQVQTVARFRLAELVSPRGRAEVDAADIRADTHESGRRAVVPNTDPVGNAAVAASVGGTESVRLPGFAGPLQTRPRALSLLLLSSFLLMLGVAMVLVRGRGEAPAAPEATEPAVAVAEPDVAVKTGPVAPSEPRPHERASAETPAPPPPASEPAPSTQPEKRPVPSRTAKFAKPSSYKAKAESKLVSLCNSKAVRACFIEKQKQGEEMRLEFDVDVATGTVRPVFPTMQRGSGLAKCLERDMKSWLLPKGGAGEPELRLGCTLNRQR